MGNQLIYSLILNNFNKDCENKLPSNEVINKLIIIK